MSAPLPATDPCLFLQRMEMVVAGVGSVPVCKVRFSFDSMPVISSYWNIPPIIAMLEACPDMQLVILSFLVQVVDKTSLRALRGYSQIRPLCQDRKSGAILKTVDKQREFCRDIMSFQVGKLHTDPRITFGNISILQLKLFSGKKRFINDFRLALKHLKIEDLCIFCGKVPLFMGKVISTWSSELKGLVILRIVFDIYPPVSKLSNVDII